MFARVGVCAYIRATADYRVTGRSASVRADTLPRSPAPEAKAESWKPTASHISVFLRLSEGSPGCLTCSLGSLRFCLRPYVFGLCE